MPKIACPQCKKVYNIPDQAVGQVATCKCGKRFRLGRRKPVGSTASARPRPNPTPQPKAAPTPAVSEPSKLSDSTWDELLAEPAKTTTSELVSTPNPFASPVSSKPVTPTPSKKKKKKKRKSQGFEWGADWGAVGGGLATFAIAGGITIVLIITTGYLFYWPAGIALLGLFGALKGLIMK